MEKPAAIVSCVTRSPLPRAARALPLAIAMLAGGCAWDGPMSTLGGRSDMARSILYVYGIVTWATVIIGTVVIGLLAWVLIRYRERPGAPLPRQIAGHSLMEIGWTILPALILLVIAIPTMQVIFRTQAPPKPGALEVQVLGKQWWWEFRYPSLDLVTANELHVPAGQTVSLRLEGPDVIHSFWVPQLGGKRDVVPGRVNRITFTPDTPGEYPGQCAEYCGTSHANMAMRVIVDAPAEFEKWVAAQKAAPGEPTGAAAEGKGVFTKSACVGCHAIQGVSAGALGPDLTHFGSRKTLAAGMFPNTVENVTAWIRMPTVMKPGAKMPAVPMTEAEAKALATYLLSLK
jgi:cytochrome c oxidase subunit 2